MDQLKTIQQNLQRELLQQNGDLVLDFNNLDHQDYYFAQLGFTREEAATRCPQLYKAMQSAPIALMDGSSSVDDYQDKYELSALLDQKRHAVLNSSVMETLQPHQCLSAVCYTYNDTDDPKHCAPLFSDSDYSMNASQLKDQFQTQSYHFGSTKQLTTVVTYTSSDKGQRPKGKILTSKTLLANSSFVQKAELLGPARTKSKQAGQIVVCYNRTTSPNEAADHVYLEAIPKDKDGKTFIPIFMPFEGTITGTPDFELEYDPSRLQLSLQIDGQSGKCYYNFEGIDFSKVFTISNDKHTLSWALRKADPQDPKKDLYNYENWGVELIGERLTNNTKLSLYALIPLIFTSEYGEKVNSIDVIFTVLSSNTSNSASTVIVDKIILWWGCLSGNSVVTLAEGVQKKLSELVAGDRLQLEDGTYSEVQCMLVGEEASMVFVETESGKILEASSDHPIQTQRGMVRAKDLHAMDRIRTEAGWEKLHTLCRKEWNRAVYTPKLSQPGCFYANGILAGDFAMQQSRLPYEEQSREWLPYESSPLEDELADLMAQRRPLGNHPGMEPAKPYYAWAFVDGGGYARVCLQNADSVPKSSFSLAFWVNVTGQSRSILSQKSGFCIGLDGDTILITAESGQTFAVTPDFPMCSTWVQVFLTFNGAQLQVGVNGMPLDTFDASGVTFLKKEDLLLGEHLTGYLRQVVIYAQCISTDLLRLRMFQNVASTEQEGLFCMVDATKTILDDIGPSRFAVLANGACSPKTLVDGYLPGKGHYVWLEGAEVNPGGTEDFSVYLKCYPLLPRKDRTVLCSNGRLGDRDAWALVSEKINRDHVRIALWYGEKHDTVVEAVAVQKWHDFLLTYNKLTSRLTVYCDGERVQDYFTVPPLGRENGNLRIGNGFGKDGRDYTAEAVFTTAAVFSRTLNIEEAQACSQEQPFLLEKNLEALFLLEGERAYEAVSGREVFVGAGELVLQPQTLATISPVHYWYDIHTDTHSYSKKAAVLYRVFSAWMWNLFGLACDAVNEEYHDAICTQMEQRLIQQPLIRELLDGQTDDSHLRACMKLFCADLEVYLHLTYANHPYNRRKSNLDNKLGMSHVIVSGNALRWAIQHALTFERSTILPGIYNAMREVM